MKKTFLLLSASVLLTAFTACQKSAPHPIVTRELSPAELQKKAEAFVPAIGKAGGKITLSSTSDPTSFNPITATETGASEWTQYLYEGLVRINGVTLKSEPSLAGSWDVSADSLTWTFHVRPGVVWSDSVPFTANDVEFTFNSLVYNSDINPNPSRDLFTIGGKRIDIKAIDSLTVQFVLPAPFVAFLRALSQEILPKHRWAGAVKKRIFSKSLGIQTPPDSMVGTGPFLLESFVSSQNVTYKKNPRYWQKDSAGNTLPYLERVVYMVVPDQNAELLRFRSGEFDYLEAQSEDFPALKKEAPVGRYSVYRLGPSAVGNFLCFNQNSGKDVGSGKPFVDPVKLVWFSDKRFRQAVSYALDRDSMIKTVLNGMGYPQWSPMGPADGFFYDTSVAQYPVNVAKAKALLAKAGFKDTNKDGILEDSSGHSVEFSCITNSGNSVRSKIGEMILKDFERLGFRVHFQQVEFGSIVQKIDNPPFEWDAVLLGLTSGPEPFFSGNVWQSSGALHVWFPRQKKPATPWESAIDSLFDMGMKELNGEKRKAIYNEWQRIAAEQLPLIYTVLPERIMCIADKFGNVNPSVNGGLLHNIERLYVIESSRILRQGE